MQELRLASALTCAVTCALAWSRRLALPITSRMIPLPQEAQSRGLDPAQWFKNAGLVWAERLGVGTVPSVHNIFQHDTLYECS